MNKYNTRLEDGVWICSCQHFRFRGTYCRHILQKLLDIRGKTDGVRDTSLDALSPIASFVLILSGVIIIIFSSSFMFIGRGT